jgi:hypothetical protein
MHPQRINNKLIGELLIERNIIDRAALENALAEQKRKGGYISQHLIALGFVTEFDIANCLTAQYSFAYLPLGNYQISREALRFIPLEIIDAYSLLPIEKMGMVLSVAMADPLNDGIIDMIEQATGYSVRVFISTYTEIRLAIDKYFPYRLQNRADKETPESKLLKQELLDKFIQTKGYEGRERRRYKRLNVDLEMVYFMRDKSFKTKIKNISYGGIFFLCDSYIAVNKDIYIHFVCKTNAEEAGVSSLVQIVRAEEIKGPQEVDTEGYKYGIGAAFVFMMGEDRNKLVKFLLETLKAGKKRQNQIKFK